MVKSAHPGNFAAQTARWSKCVYHVCVQDELVRETSYLTTTTTYTDRIITLLPWTQSRKQLKIWSCVKKAHLLAIAKLQKGGVLNGQYLFEDTKVKSSHASLLSFPYTHNMRQSLYNTLKCSLRNAHYLRD
jgi:hypothetical protein